MFFIVSVFCVYKLKWFLGKYIFCHCQNKDINLFLTKSALSYFFLPKLYGFNPSVTLFRTQSKFKV